MHPKVALLSLIRLEFGRAVQHLDVELRRTLNNLLALARRDVVGDLRRIPGTEGDHIARQKGAVASQLEPPIATGS